MKQLFNKQIALFFILVLGLLTGALSQSVGNYSVSRSTGTTYSTIMSTGSSFASWRYNGFYSMDDNRSQFTDIGFDFWYNGTRYTQFCVSTNGFIDFSSSTDDGGPQADDFGYVNSAFTAEAIGSATRPALAVFYDDMTTQGGGDPLGNSIKYQLDGAEPNRVLTVEWDNMAVYQNTSPDLNFQVKIYENTGVIEYLYETMVTGTKTFSYTIGINAETMGATPSAAELLTQQTANSATFTNAVQNNLSAMPASNSKLTFTPPVPAAPVGSIAFSSITNTGMTLDWTDWASNEVGYVIYYSTNGVDYFFQEQVGAGVVSAVISGLSPSTTYSWRVYAVTEGAFSPALTGSETTLAPATIVSSGNGGWQNGGTWVGGVKPGAGDNVLIRDGHRVTLRTSGEACNDLTIGEGASGQLRLGNNGTARELSVGGDVLVNNGGQIYTNTNSNTTHTLNIQGDIVNEGTINMKSDAASLCLVNFNKTDGSQSLSGSGTNTFHTIELTKALKSNEFEVLASDFTCTDDGISIVDGGTFKFSSSGANTITPYGTAQSIPAKGKFWMNSANSTMNFGASLETEGDLIVDNGTVNVGNAVDENLVSRGGMIEVNGGVLNVAGRYDRFNSDATSNFTISGGSFVVPTSGSASTTRAPFHMDVSGSNFNMTGGVITLQEEGGTGAENLGFITTGVSSGNVTGGVLEVGNGATQAGQTMLINSPTNIGGLTLNSANATAQLVSNDLTIVGDVLLNSGSFDPNNLTVTLGGDWTANGATFVSGTSTVSFDGSGNIQNILGSDLSEAFYNVSVSASSGLNIGVGFSVSVTGSISNSGVLDNDGVVDFSNGYDTQSGTLSGDGQHILSGGNWNLSTGVFTTENSTVEMKGSVSQTIQGATAFNNLIIDNPNGVSISADNHSIRNTLTLTSGLFSTNNALTLLADATGTARIAEITGGSITGSITAQQYLSGNDDWRLLSSPVSGTTLADWNNSFWMSGFTGSDYPTNSFISTYTYDESVQGDLDQGYIAATDITNVISPTTGLFTWVGALPVGSGITTTFALDGSANTGDQVVAVSYTDDPSMDDSNDGWMLIGNPYPSDIDWSTVAISGGVTQFAYVYDPGTATYLTLDQSSSNVIAQHQGFWVKASGSSGTITFQESDKVSGGTFFKYSKTNSLALFVEGQGYSNSTQVRVNDSASYNYDPNFDAFKWYSTDPLAPNIMTLSGNGYELDINTVNDSDQAFSIPVKLIVGAGMSGVYSIAIDDSSALSAHSCIFLEDLHEGVTVNLRTDPSYSFYISDTVSSARFLLHLGEKVVMESSDFLCYGDENGVIELGGKGTPPWNYEIIDLTNDDTITAQNVFTPLSFDGYGAGAYEVSITNVNGECATVYSALTIDEVSEILVDDQTTHVKCYGDNTGFVQIDVSGGNSPYTYEWSIGESLSFVDGLSQGIYEVSVTDSTGCVTYHQIIVEEPEEMILSSTSNDPSCFGTSTGNIIVNCDGGSSPYSYLWSTGDDGNEVNNLADGEYTIEVMDTNNCTKTIIVTLTEPALVEADFSVSSVSVQINEIIDFTNESEGATSYVWDFGDGNIDQQPNPQHYYDSAGLYIVNLEVMNDNGCLDDYSVAMLVSEPTTTSINEESVGLISVGIRNEFLIINVGQGLTESITVYMYNSVGQLVLEQSVSEGMSSSSVSLSNITPGIYTVDIRDVDGVNLHTARILNK